MTHRTARALLIVSLALWSAWIGAGCVAPGPPSAPAAPIAPATAAGVPAGQTAASTTDGAGDAAAPTAAMEVYRQVAPSLAMVEIPTGTGSGIVIAGGYVLTNAHV
ncbi:MAG: hypothetical protein GX649_00020, partial [Chloroflexi bacterium]|nr:hypothetical protein [Chloroflexota bacterium]